MLKTVVIGVGYLGRFHAQKYAALPDCKLLGVIDSDPKRAAEIGTELGVPHYSEIRELEEKPDAASIVVPTVHHHAVASQCLARGIHVLLEKPFAGNLEQARELEMLAKTQSLCLQIGHLERFNPVFTEFQKTINSPRFIEALRIAPFPKRGTDVDVILDLMIHDIDLILSLTGSYPEQVEATGVSILTPTTDLANARLRFPGGCIANLTASRVSDKAERKMRVFQQGSYFSLDFGNGLARRLQVDGNKPLEPEMLHPEEIQLERGDALLTEIQHFLSAIRSGREPKVPARDGLNAMRVAWEIKEQIP